MVTIWNLPRVEIQSLKTIEEKRHVALITGATAWSIASSILKLPVVAQAEPLTAERSQMDTLADNLPQQSQVLYAVGGGLVADVAKYVGWRRNLPVVVVPTVLSVDGFFTAIVATREGGTVVYQDTGPAERVIIDWDIVAAAPPHFRGTGIAEILSIVTGLLDWRYAGERSKNRPDERFQPWAAGLAAGIAQQAFKIAKGVGEGRTDSLRNLLDLICMEVQLTNQLGHNRPQEGSEQYFAYAIEPKAARDHGVPYADLIGPGIMIAAALHGQDVGPIRNTLETAGIRLGQLKPDDISDTLQNIRGYVQQHDLPFGIVHDTSIDANRAHELMTITGLNS